MGKSGISFRCYHGENPVTGVTTSGLKYPLNGEILFSFGSRGLSNVLETDYVTITFKKGILLCVLQSSHV